MNIDGWHCGGKSIDEFVLDGVIYFKEDSYHCQYISDLATLTYIKGMNYMKLKWEGLTVNGMLWRSVDVKL